MNMKVRLAIMNFLEFAVWGAYLTCMGNYLGMAGLGDKISWFYAIQGIVSIFMPTLMGIVADKYIQPQRLLGLCHLAAGAFMISCWWMGEQAGFGNELTNKSLFIALYTLSVAFYMPTIALTNTTAFTILKNNGLDTVKDFPPIRVLGTVGFIITMWFVNCAFIDDSGFGFTLGDSPYKFQYTYLQFLVSGILSIVLFLYCFTLPECKLEKKEGCVSLVESLGLNAFKLFKRRQMALFFIFSALLGMCLQVTNGFAGPFLTSFKGVPEYADTFAANNATLLTSISQISEACCILLIPFFLKRFGIKIVMLMSLFAWVFRFGFFGIGKLRHSLETGEERSGEAIGDLQAHAQQCREDEEQGHLATLEEFEGIESETLGKWHFTFFLLQLAFGQCETIGKEHDAQQTRNEELHVCILELM